jgi:hypothetical protein
MAYNDLTVAQMIEQGTRLTKPEAEGGMRHLLEGQPLLASYVPLLDAVLAEMLGMQVQLSALEPVIRQLTVEIGDEDAVGDATLSGIRAVATGARALMDDPTALDAAIAALFGQQDLFRLVNAPYSALGGEARLMAERLKPEHWAALEAINLGGVTLKDGLERWMELARSISDKDARRKELGVQRDDAVTRAQVRELRFRWIRVIRALEMNVALSGLSERERAILMAPLEQAAEAAGRRSASPAG